MTEHPLTRMRKALAAHYPLIHVLCDDEERLERYVDELATAHYHDARAPLVWSCTRGFTSNGGVVHAVTDPLEAVHHVLTADEERFYVLKDVAALAADRPVLARALRDLYDVLARRDSFVFLPATRQTIPDVLAHQLFAVDLGIAPADELHAELRRLAATEPRLQALPDGWFEHCAAAMKGLAVGAVRHLARRLLAEDKLALERALHEIRDEKGAALMREACLKFVADSVDIDRVGGLEHLKEWVLARQALFAGGEATAGVPLPSGVLFMGVSGCGKSMAAKVIAGAWRLPLVRLDMNLVLSGAFGSPEYAFDHALRVAEQIAPLVLWIDEMENSFGYDVGSGGGNNPNIFSSFLTWMQEKPAGVFVVATANRIERLPAEVIRKGRFDQLFFLDLPDGDERRAILDIHLRAAGADPSAFNLAALAAVTKNWSGAEIEQAIRAAVVHAWQERRAFTERDVMWSTARMVPLARTMDEQIKALRQWSQERATPASRKSTT